MSGWTVITVRGIASKHYDRVDYDSTDPWDATADIVATMDGDDRVRSWTTWSSHVYTYLNTSRYDWEFAEDFLADCRAMIRDAVVLGANDTTDTGTARYYDGDVTLVDEYAEDPAEDGHNVGEIALSAISARHGIVARDPFHNKTGTLDDRYLEDGTNVLPQQDS